MGYPHELHVYGLRRRSATELAEMLGPDTARKILNHDPNSRSMELYYMNIVPKINLSAQMLYEKPSAASAKEMEMTQKSLALQKLSTEQAALLPSHLRTMEQWLMAQDVDLPHDAKPAEWKLYKRRIRRAAKKAVLADELKKERDTITRADMDKRFELMEECKFMERVLEYAKKNLADRTVGEGENEEDEEDEEDENDPLKDLPPEEDLEDQPSSANNTHIRHVDEGNATEEDDTPYIDAVKSMMEVLLEHKFSDYHNWSLHPISCPKCAADETISDEDKARVFRDRAKFQRHIDGNFHTRKWQWIRNYEIQYPREEKSFPCPYCPEENTHIFNNFDHLIRHTSIEKAKIGGDHDEQKRADGWYDEAWYPEGK